MLVEVDTASPEVQVHGFFRGNADSSVARITKVGANRAINTHVWPKLEWISINDLEPLESQRVTKQKWTDKRLEALGGLDMWAFGTLDVCRDPRDNKNYVWNGCGRLALAQLYARSAGLSDFVVPCTVIEGEKETAAFYFGYCQDSQQGRRTLSKEVLFVNRWYSGDISARREGQLLSQLGLYIKGDTDMPVPQPVQAGAVEIGYRAFAEGMKIADQDVALVREARDLIVTAWSNNPNGCRMINQDIFWAVIMLLRVYPEVRDTGTKNSINKKFKQFLAHVAMGQDQNKVRWKMPGLSGNSGVAGELTYGLLKAWKAQTSFYPKINTKNGNSVLTYSRLKDYIGRNLEEDQA